MASVPCDFCNSRVDERTLTPFDEALICHGCNANHTDEELRNEFQARVQKYG